MFQTTNQMRCLEINATDFGVKTTMLGFDSYSACMPRPQTGDTSAYEKYQATSVMLW